jgi:hypothetical protein
VKTYQTLLNSGRELSHLGVGGDNQKIRLPSRKPRLLISYAYYKSLENHFNRLYFDTWILDSGAFTAWNAGKPVSLVEYIEFCKRVHDGEYPPVEIYGLDDIQDWKQTKRNVEAMWKAGVEAIPTYHVGEPPEVLRGYAKDYPKVALGGMVRKHSTVKEKFLDLSFAVAWPKKFHAFGLDIERLLLKYPIHSADSSSWVSKPCIFGKWSKYGDLSWKGSNQDLRSEMERIFTIEDKANVIFKRELAMLENNCS